MRLGVAAGPGLRRRAPARARPTLVDALRRPRRAATLAAIGWYDVFARWKLAIVLEGSYAKFLRGESDKPIHEYFGPQADLLLRAPQATERRSA